MSLHMIRSSIGAGIFALAALPQALPHAQNAQQVASDLNVILAQGTIQPAPADAKPASKNKAKKPKHGTEKRPGGTPQPAPAGGGGPSDPGKYL
jgi:hypothetical protein